MPCGGVATSSTPSPNGTSGPSTSRPPWGCSGRSSPHWPCSPSSPSFSPGRKSTGIPGIPYPIFAYIGILCWTFFSQALGTGGTSLLTNNALMGKTQFPRECFPLETILVTAVNTVLSWIPLAVLFVVYRLRPAPTTVWVPLLMVIELLFAAGVTLAVSAMIIQMRDLAQVLPIVIQLGLFATPVIWQFKDVPARCRIIYGFFNPLGPVIDNARRTMLLGLNPVPGPLHRGHGRHCLLPAVGLSAVQAVGGELCRHCLTGPSASSTCGRSSAPIGRRRSSTTRSSACVGRFLSRSAPTTAGS